MSPFSFKSISWRWNTRSGLGTIDSVDLIANWLTVLSNESVASWKIQLHERRTTAVYSHFSVGSIANGFIAIWTTCVLNEMEFVPFHGDILTEVFIAIHAGGEVHVGV